jgi:hypothetical protein
MLTRMVSLAGMPATGGRQRVCELAHVAPAMHYTRGKENVVDDFRACSWTRVDRRPLCYWCSTCARLLPSVHAHAPRYVTASLCISSSASHPGTPCLAATDGPLLWVDPSYSGNYMLSPDHVGMLMLIHTATQQPGRISLTCIPASPHRQQACCFASVQLLCLKLRFMLFGASRIFGHTAQPPLLHTGGLGPEASASRARDQLLVPSLHRFTAS